VGACRRAGPRAVDHRVRQSDRSERCARGRGDATHHHRHNHQTAARTPCPTDGGHPTHHRDRRLTSTPEQKASGLERAVAGPTAGTSYGAAGVSAKPGNALLYQITVSTPGWPKRHSRSSCPTRPSFTTASAAHRPQPWAACRGAPAGPADGTIPPTSAPDSRSVPPS